jgi:hypothetical protein
MAFFGPFGFLPPLGAAGAAGGALPSERKVRYSLRSS